jgi:hypothetical protein
MKLRSLVILPLLLCAFAFAQAPHNSVTLTVTPAAGQPTGVVVTGYNFYQSSTSGSGYVKIGSVGTASPVQFTTAVQDGGIAGGSGKTYFFVARAFRDPCLNCTPAETVPVESANSPEASAFIAAPLLPPPAAPNAPTGVTTKVN